MEDNRDLFCFYTVKLSWKGKYNRIFSVGTNGITTYNLHNNEITNRWPYSEFIGINPSTNSPHEFIITMRKTGRKTDSMKFTSDFRSEILTEALRFHHLFCDSTHRARAFNGFKRHWSESRKKVQLETGLNGLMQIDVENNRVLCQYDYKDIEKLIRLSDYPHGFVVCHGGFGRLHLFASEQRDTILTSIVEKAANHIGINLKIANEVLSYDWFIENRLGMLGSDECITSLSEFNVHKNSIRHSDPVKRIFCITASSIVERDPTSYEIVTLKPLGDIYAVIREHTNPQSFHIEYVNGLKRYYLSADRDALIATLLDGVRASGNDDVHVLSNPFQRGKRIGPLTTYVDDDVEIHYLKMLSSSPMGMSKFDIIKRFNANIPYSGIMNASTSDKSYRFITHAINELVLQSDSELSLTFDTKETKQLKSYQIDEMEQYFHALRRLVATKAGFSAFVTLTGFREKIGLKIIRALSLRQPAVSHAAVDMLCALMQPMHDDYELRQEQLNKASLLASKRFLETLLNIFSEHVQYGTGALVVAALLDFFTFAVCPPFSETTDGAAFDLLLRLLADKGRELFQLFSHPSLTIVKGAGLLMQSLIEEGDKELAKKMQQLSLTEAALPRHIHTSLFTSMNVDARRLALRQLSRTLVTLWCVDNDDAYNLLQRMIPSSLLRTLDSKEEAPLEKEFLLTRNNLELAGKDPRPSAAANIANAAVEAITSSKIGSVISSKAKDVVDQIKTSGQGQKAIQNVQTVQRKLERNLATTLEHWRSRASANRRIDLGKKKENMAPVVLRRRRRNVESTKNWNYFYYQFIQNHAQPDLIWNYRTREELREILENELRSFEQEKELCSTFHVAWNHREFEVSYICLQSELKIGDYYLRLLLEQDESLNLLLKGSKFAMKDNRRLEAIEQKIEEEKRKSLPEYDEDDDSERIRIKNKQKKKLNDNDELENDEGEGNVDVEILSEKKSFEFYDGNESDRNSKAYEFFNQLYHKFLLSNKNLEMRCMCLQAMAIVYGRCHDNIGHFTDTRHIIEMLKNSEDKMERDRLLIFISKLVMNHKNVKDILDSNGLYILVDFLSLSHLHVSRARLPAQSNVIEAAPNSEREQTKEWYYTLPNTKERHGPFSLKEMKEFYLNKSITNETKCWASGIDGWKTLRNICQLKWTLMANENLPGNESLKSALLNESEIAIMVLNILIHVIEHWPIRDVEGAIVRPIPRVRRLLADPTILPHIVQLLLTFDPIIVEKVAQLLYEIVLDNPILPRIHLYGVFYFILMYTGSNIMPIAKFLKYCHLKQAYHNNEETSLSEIVQRSILTPILPDALVCYLEHYEPEKFAEMYLGQSNNPEVIWNGEMRRRMIEKLALQIAEFSPRLQCNTKALYQYCPLAPRIEYPQLEGELFCSPGYYLRHLCNSDKYDGWEIRDPVKLLKAALRAWKAEVEKKPPNMNVDDALQILQMKKDDLITSDGIQFDEKKIRRMYFKLAQIYHPDKNSEGREMFEKVNKAYEFLCGISKKGATVSGPDPYNVVLLLRTQSILFQRYTKILRPYKYAGYGLLLKTLELQTDDESLFSQTVPVLPAAVELAHDTLACSALNVEELRRENGLQSLFKAFRRCVEVLGGRQSTLTDEDTAPSVSRHAIRCFSVATRFKECAKILAELCPQLSKDVGRSLYVASGGITASAFGASTDNNAGLPKLACCVAELVDAAAISNEDELTMAFLNSGVTYHLLLTVFAYDYTLEDGGVAKSNETNSQELINSMARQALLACAALAGIWPGRNDGELTGPATLAMRAMLTPFIIKELEELHKCLPLRKFADDEPNEEELVECQKKEKENELKIKNIVGNVLRLLTSNSITPLFVWDNGTRAELIEYLESESESLARRGICDKSLGASFEFKSHNKELIVGEVFLRVFNEQPQFPLPDPKQFCIDLLNFLATTVQYIKSKETLENQQKKAVVKEREKDEWGEFKGAETDNLINLDDEESEKEKNKIISENTRYYETQLALQSLMNVISHNTGIETSCVDNFRLIFTLLRISSPSIQYLTLCVIRSVCGNSTCINDIASNSQICIPQIIPLLSNPPKCSQNFEKSDEKQQIRLNVTTSQSLIILLEILHAFSSNTQLLKEIILYGGLVYTLNCFSNMSTQGQTVRERSAELICKFTSDSLVGPRIRLLLLKYLPPLIVDMMNENSSTAVHIFESNQENPELIWNDTIRDHISEVIEGETKKLYEKQINTDQSVRWDPPSDKNDPYYADSESGEVVVDGVFIRLLIENVTWNLRHPNKFLSELFDTWLEMIQKKNFETEQERFEMISTAIIKLLSDPQRYSHMLPQKGIIARIINLILIQKSVVIKQAISILQMVTLSDDCLRHMSTTCPNTMDAFNFAIKHSKEAVPSAIDSLHNIFSNVDYVEEFTEQIVKSQMVKLLLQLLDHPLSNLNVPVAGLKAQIVKILKSMTRSMQFGDRISQQLDQSTVWAQYKDQKHDLFIEDKSSTLAITGGDSSTNTAGYLTYNLTSQKQGSSLHSSAPPPIQDIPSDTD
ncbi:hypothetical protein SNEBB_010043 [Seison nebaliae]|nr:hypothetical protein SNEBB_010043 [Seison nebaliae]